MTGFRRMNVVLASAAALLAVSSSLPASAENSASQSAAEVTQARGAEIPTPRARPVRKRIASAAPVRRFSPPQPYWFYRPYERVVAHWPMLFIGVGF